jgi:hypothetical protein
MAAYRHVTLPRSGKSRAPGGLRLLGLGRRQVSVTAETTFGAAIGYDWLYHFLNDNEREQVVRAIGDKAIKPAFAQFAVPVPPYWTTTPMNWNLVCNGALVITALSVAESNAKAADLFSLCRASIATGFDGTAPMAGGWKGQVIGTTPRNMRSTSSTACARH